MSMWLEYAMVDEATFEKAKEDEGVCDAIFFADEAPAGVDRATQVIGLDYRTLSAMIEGMEDSYRWYSVLRIVECTTCFSRCRPAAYLSGARIHGFKRLMA